jgi:putative hydrolase of the HAD superfamily
MTSLKDIRAVTFDAGGTLIEPWPSVGHIYAEVAAQQGYGNFPPEELNRRFIQAWRSRADFGYTKKEWAAVVDETFAGLAAQPPSGTFFRELYEQFTRTSAWRIYDDVRSTLEGLSAAGIRLGVISNWDERLRPLLNELGLAKYFDVIVVSCEAGCTKPAKEIFALAARSFGLPSGQILHVGDGAREDVQGAQAAGFQTAHLVRSADAVRNGQLKTLAQLVLR